MALSLIRIEQKVGGCKILSSAILFADSSNIHIETMKIFGGSARFSYKNFEKLYYGNDIFVEKHITGSISTPHATDVFWNRMRQNGYTVRTYERRKHYGKSGSKEKVVDTSIVARGAQSITKHNPDIVVLLSGDLDMLPLAEIAREDNCEVHTWSFSASLSHELERASDEVFYIDDYLNELIFFQYADGNIETLEERNSRNFEIINLQNLALEQQVALEQQAQVPAIEQEYNDMLIKEETLGIPEIDNAIKKAQETVVRQKSGGKPKERPAWKRVLTNLGVGFGVGITTAVVGGAIIAKNSDRRRVLMLINKMNKMDKMKKAKR